MTEISPVGTMVNDTDAADTSRSAGKSGRLLPGTEARIMDPTTGKYIDPGTEGELLIRGPQVVLCVSLNRVIVMVMCTGHEGVLQKPRSYFCDYPIRRIHAYRRHGVL